MNLPRRGELHRPETAPAPLVLDGNLKRLVLSYSLAGFGYILPATFLSQLAATRFPHSLFAQFVWPVFGGAAVIGIALGILTRRWAAAHLRLAVALWAQAIGVFIGGLLPGLGGLAAGALLTGGGFLRGATDVAVWPRTGAAAYALSGGAADHRLRRRPAGRAAALPAFQPVMAPAGAGAVRGGRGAAAGWRAGLAPRRMKGFQGRLKGFTG